MGTGQNCLMIKFFEETFARRQFCTEGHFCIRVKKTENKIYKKIHKLINKQNKKNYWPKVKTRGNGERKNIKK